MLGFGTTIDGLVYSNDASIHTIDFPIQIDTIQRNGAYEIVWKGDELADKELVTVTITGENEGDTQIFLASNSGMKEIILSKRKLKKVGQGPRTVWMDRSYIPLMEEETEAGGMRIGRYRPIHENLFFL